MTTTQTKRPLDIWVFVIGIFAIAVIGIAVFIINYSGKTPEVSKTPPTALSPEVSLSIGNNNGVITTLTEEEAQGRPNQMDIYLDYACSFCGVFELEGGGTELANILEEDEELAVNFHLMNFLNRGSATDYSSRAAAASLKVAETSPEAWLEFNKALFGNAPFVTQEEMTDQELTDLAQSVGASIILTDEYHGWLDASNSANLKTVDSTPTVILNGDTIDPSVVMVPEEFLAYYDANKK